MIEEFCWARLYGAGVHVWSEDRRRLIRKIDVSYTRYEIPELNEVLRRHGHPVLSAWVIITDPDGLILEAAVQPPRP